MSVGYIAELPRSSAICVARIRREESVSIKWSRHMGLTAMRDITCARCGEPWSEYALRHDVPDWEGEPDDAHDRFMRGDGCPTCDWGEKAGDVSRSRTEDADELEAEHLKDVMRETDEDPLKYI